MSETIDSIIKAATDEIRDYFLKGIADGMTSEHRIVTNATGRNREAFELGFYIGKDAGCYRSSKTTAPPTPPAKADEWPKVWISHDSGTMWFKRRDKAPLLCMFTLHGTEVRISACEQAVIERDEIRLIPEARP